jgi:hypothetical protein
LLAEMWHNPGLIFAMKNKTAKSNETQVLALLKKILPKATTDAELAQKIYQAAEVELQSRSKSGAFDKFCSRIELADLEEKSLEQVKEQLTSAFGEADVTLKPNRKEKTLAVELALPDGTQFSGEIAVNPNAGAEEEEPEFKPKFVPFPVCLPGDIELVWLLAKHETMTPDEAGIALHKIEEDFWGSKAGQKLLRDRVERIFPEFISRVPSGMLTELGLKRHYKTPEPVKVLKKGKG